jgi:hypothetical protein
MTVLSFLVACVFVVTFFYLYGIYEKQKEKADKIEAMKESGDIRVRMMTTLYKTWESREDVGLAYPILRDLVMSELDEKDKDRAYHIPKIGICLEALKSEGLVVLDADNIVELTDTGIEYYEKLIKKGE